MSSGELFNYIVSISFVVLAGSAVYLAVRLTSTLEKIDHILSEVKSVTDEVEIFKNGLKMGLMTLISSLVGKLVSKPTKEVKLDE